MTARPTPLPTARQHHTEMTLDGTVWTVDATADDGHVTVELLAADDGDGTVVAQLRLDGDRSHLELLEDVARELQTHLCGRAPRRRPGAYRLADIRTRLPRAYAPWTEADETLLLERWDAGASLDELAEALQRGPGGVRSRLVRLGRVEEAG